MLHASPTSVAVLHLPQLGNMALCFQGGAH